MLKIYNTFKKQKELFRPLHPGKVGIYVCGVTVYDHCHLGHGRTFIVFDMVVRYLRYLGYQVKYIRNVTDIDDKIIQRAKSGGESHSQLSRRWLTQMHTDFDQLGLLRPDEEPLATENLPQMLQLIASLMEQGQAYQAESGDVLFSVENYPDYGQLSGQRVDQLQAGARVDLTEGKRNQLDFVLWKKAKRGEPSWASPWGPGRPGWHIECSAMSLQCLGPHFDIHGGGSDLLFPHHENERAQSCCANDSPFVNYWMHSGMVMVDQEKMAKSLGNFATLRSLLEKYDHETVRYFLLSSHYRSQLSYRIESLPQARAALERLYTALHGFEVNSIQVSEGGEFEQEFRAAMDDDFNLPEAYAVMFEVAREINRLRNSDQPRAASLAGRLRHMAGVLGLLQQDATAFFHRSNSPELGGQDELFKKIEDLVTIRDEARRHKEWEAADTAREQLAQLGVTLQDTPSGTTWRISQQL